MNATHPSPGPTEQEHEALHRAQKLHEPSMEEILASIRAIIADDRDGARAETSPSEPPKSTPPSEPRIVYSNDYPTPPAWATSDDAAPSARSEEPSEGAAPVEPAAQPTPMVVWARPRIEPPPSAPAAEPVSAPSPSEPESGPLLSDEADRSVATSFEALSATVALRSTELVDRLTREMLRPMIKTWLDEHLPSLVERLVRAEIQRVARGGR
jgi:hypothetical protein